MCAILYLLCPKTNINEWHASWSIGFSARIFPFSRPFSTRFLFRAFISFSKKRKKQSILIDLIIFPKKSLLSFEGSFIISWKIIREEDWIHEINLKATRNSTATGLTGSLDDNNSRIIIHFGKQHLRFDKLCWFIPLIDFIQSYPTLDEIAKKVNSTNQPYPLSSSLEIISLSFEIKNTDCFPPLSLSPLLSSQIPIKS